jgi:hypothetical protein
VFHVINHVFVQLAVYVKIDTFKLFIYLFTYKYGLFKSTTRYSYYIVLNIRVVGE